MFAIIQTGGKQYKVQEGNKITIEKLDKGSGEKVVFEKVLLIENGDKILIGNPFLPKARVEGTILNQVKAKKIIIFKKKSKKGYKKKTGHRQKLIEVQIEKIIPDYKAKAEKPEKPQVRTKSTKRKAETVKRKPIESNASKKQKTKKLKK